MHYLLNDFKYCIAVLYCCLSLFFNKAHCSVTHRKQQKSFDFCSLALGRGCNGSHILHPLPNGGLEETE